MDPVANNRFLVKGRISKINDESFKFLNPSPPFFNRLVSYFSSSPYYRLVLYNYILGYKITSSGISWLHSYTVCTHM